MKPRVRRIGLGLLAASLGVAALLACGKNVLPPDGELVLVLSSDMAPPKDFDLVRVTATAQGETRPFYANDFYFTGQDKKTLPATVAFIGGHSRAPVLIGVEARKGGPVGKIVVAREVRTVIPADRIAMLPVPIQAVCLDVLPEGAASGCLTGQTCVGGRCAGIDVDSSTLSDFDPKSVFGGGATPSEGTCFDTLRCFAHAGETPVREIVGEDCFVDAPSGVGDVNLALLYGPSELGVCAANACLVPLDNDPLFGWVRDDTRGTPRLRLAARACRLGRPLVVATDCPSKRPSLPVCGEWSSVSGESVADASIAVVLAPDAAPADAGPDAPIDAPIDAPVDVDGAADAAVDAAVDASATCELGSLRCGASLDGGVTTLPYRCDDGGVWTPLAECPGNQSCGAGTCKDREWLAAKPAGLGTTADGGTPTIDLANFALTATVVRDLSTKLEWLRDVPQAYYDFPSAAKYCAQRNVDGGGWRLPTMAELYTVVEFGPTRPLPSIFGDPSTRYLWSVSSPQSGYRWTVTSQSAAGFSQETAANAVLCVR